MSSSENGTCSTEPMVPTGNRWRVMLFVGIVATTAVWSGMERSPANPITPLILQGTVSDKPLVTPTLKVASFNIHGGKGLDDVRDLSRIARLLKGYDLAGLYEVHSQNFGFGNDMGREIGQQLGMASVFCPSVRKWWHDNFGNALVTKTALLNLQCIPLPGTRAHKSRNIILSRFLFQGQQVNLLCVHIDRVNDRKQQLKTVIQLFLSMEQPVILMGDFNTRIDDPQLQALLKQPGIIECVGHISKKKEPNQIDWIFTRGLQCVNAELVENDASDHPLVWAELKLPQKD